MESTATCRAVDQLAAGRWSDVPDLAGRIMIAAIFIIGGADKLFGHAAQTVQMMQAYGVPLAAGYLFG